MSLLLESSITGEAGPNNGSRMTDIFLVYPLYKLMEAFSHVSLCFVFLQAGFCFLLLLDDLHEILLGS